MDYYVISNQYFSDVPLLKNDDDVDVSGIHFLSRKEVVDSGYVVHLCFAPPIPSAPRLNDALDLDGVCSVFSEKIVNALTPMNIPGLQLVTTIIKGKKGEEYHNFRTANIYNRRSFFDQSKSTFGRVSKITNEWMNIEKISLDEELLSSVPLAERLVFVAEENASFILYHKSVVDLIMSTDPEGVLFTSVNDWTNGSDAGPEDGISIDDIDLSFLNGMF